MWGLVQSGHGRATTANTHAEARGGRGKKVAQYVDCTFVRHCNCIEVQEAELGPAFHKLAGWVEEEGLLAGTMACLARSRKRRAQQD